MTADASTGASQIHAQECNQRQAQEAVGNGAACGTFLARATAFAEGARPTQHNGTRPLEIGRWIVREWRTPALGQSQADSPRFASAFRRQDQADARSKPARR